MVRNGGKGEKEKFPGLPGIFLNQIQCYDKMLTTFIPHQDKKGFINVVFFVFDLIVKRLVRIFT